MMYEPIGHHEGVKCKKCGYHNFMPFDKVVACMHCRKELPKNELIEDEYTGGGNFFCKDCTKILKEKRTTYRKWLEDFVKTEVRNDNTYKKRV